MKAIIPVAGAGTMLRPHTYTQPKALIPLAGQTILSIIVNQLYDAGVKDFIFVIGYLGEKIKDYVELNLKHINASFVSQANRYGVGHAIELTEHLVGNDKLIIVLGDTIAEFDVEAVLKSDCSMLGIKKVDDPRLFGVAELSNEGMIERVVEKPSIPKSNMALVGIYKIDETEVLFDCLKKIEKQKASTYNEFNLTEAIQCMIHKGVVFKPFKVNHWFDCGRKESLIQSNSILLKKQGSKNEVSPHYSSSIIIPPVNIGKGVVIVNSVIGPNVSIGENATLSHCIVKDSIIGSYSNIVDILLSQSLIGSDAEVKGVRRSLSIGDNTSIDLGSPNE